MFILLLKASGMLSARGSGTEEETRTGDKEGPKLRSHVLGSSIHVYTNESWAG